MANELTIYAKPPHAQVTCLLDNGVNLLLPSTIVQGRDDAHQAVLPGGTTTQGCVITATCDGRVTQRVRGTVFPADVGPAAFWFDDFGELAIVEVPPTPDLEPPPNPYADPWMIIQTVYSAAVFDLSTKEGCGTYTEACVEALHAEQSKGWGHIRKAPGQNQWNGHAVDAILLLAAAGDTAAGCYDIIWSTESPEAKPIWSYKGPDPNAAQVWYYGPMPAPPL